MLRETNEIRYEHLFVDGTKIEANANKYSFVWKKSTSKYEERNNSKIEKLFRELSRKHGIVCKDEESLLEILYSRVGKPFVHGRGHPKPEIQRDIEQLEEKLARRNKYSTYQETFKGRNSLFLLFSFWLARKVMSRLFCLHRQGTLQLLQIFSPSAI